MPVTIAVALPTIGRDTLERSLDAISSQRLIHGDEILVVYDLHHGPAPDLRARVACYAPFATYHEHDAGTSFKGVFQTNAAFRMARADLVLAHSDDDVYTPGAFAHLRSLAEANPYCPIVFRNISPRGNVTWPDGEPRLRRHSLGGGSLAAPRRYLHQLHYPCEGIDYYWVCEVLAHAAADGHLPVWTDQILMRGRNMERRT